MPESRLERTREAYTDQTIAICPLCDEPLTDDHDCTPLPPTDDERDLWGV